jgi:hypothetical protein
MMPPMVPIEPTPQAEPAGELLVSTAAQLRERRDALEPLVAEYERAKRVSAALGEPDDAGDRAPGGVAPVPEYGELVAGLEEMRGALRDWFASLEPLVREYTQVLHVLAAVETAGTLDASRIGRGGRRGGPRTASGQARADELRGLLTEPRARAELGEMMGLSPGRVTELLEPLARAGEVVETRDPEHPTRKLWVLAPREDDGADPAQAAVSA